MDAVMSMDVPFVGVWEVVAQTGRRYLYIVSRECRGGDTSTALAFDGVGRRRAVILCLRLIDLNY